VQNTTIQTLGQIGNKKAIQTLKAVDIMNKPSVVRKYTKILAQLHDSLAFQTLLDYSKSTDFQIRENVIVGLTRMSDLYEESTMRRIFKKMLAEVDTMKVDTISYDKIEIENEKDELRAKIAIALLKANDRSAMGHVDKIVARKDFSPKVNLVELIGLASIQGAEDVLVRFTSDRSTYVRSKTAEALGRVGSPSAVRHLHDMLAKEKNDEIRVAVATALLKTDEKLAAEVLQSALSTPDDDLKTKTLLALANVQSDGLRKELIPVIRQQAKGASEWVMIGVLGALGSYRDTTSMDFYEDALSDQRLQVRELAIGVLASLRPADMLGDLAAFAKDEQYSVRSVAISGLGKIENKALLDQTVIPILFDRMRNDPEMIVRVRAAFTLLDVLHDRVYTLGKRT